MRVATVANGRRDGLLGVVSRDGARIVTAPGAIPTLQAALDDWDAAAPALRDAADAADGGAGEALGAHRLMAPLPRAYHWSDASTYLEHMVRIRGSRGMELPPYHDQEPIVYQSGSDPFLAFDAPVPLAEPELGLDLEATVAIVTGDVVQGASREEALAAVRLVVLTNDYTYRHVLPREYAKGVGFYQGKPARPFAPFAVTPDGLGDAWADGLLHATLTVTVNDERLGRLDTGADCAFDFGAILTYLTRTRELRAGAIVASGTISNRDATRGFGCLAERRAVEQSRDGAPTTELLAIGDRVRIEARVGKDAPFGHLDNEIVAQRLPTIPTPIKETT